MRHLDRVWMTECTLQWSSKSMTLDSTDYLVSLVLLLIFPTEWKMTIVHSIGIYQRAMWPKYCVVWDLSIYSIFFFLLIQAQLNATVTSYIWEIVAVEDCLYHMLNTFNSTPENLRVGVVQPSTIQQDWVLLSCMQKAFSVQEFGWYYTQNVSTKHSPLQSWKVAGKIFFWCVPLKNTAMVASGLFNLQ